jgi:hypothetical protein
VQHVVPFKILKIINKDQAALDLYFLFFFCGLVANDIELSNQKEFIKDFIAVAEFKLLHY